MSNKINLLNHGYVRLVESMGSDLSVVRNAHLECTQCKQVQPRENFPDAKYRGKSYSNGPRGGKSSHCKACNNLRAKVWAKGNPEKVALNARKRHLSAKFGISIEDFNVMLLEQNNSCVICGCGIASERSRQQNFCVDHNHATGAVRGLLCDSCNLVLGYANDDVKLLKKCITYLEKSNG